MTKHFGYDNHCHLPLQNGPNALGPLTQSVEYLPFKQRVAGSSPARPTRSPSSSPVQDTGLSRRQQGFKSPRGRHFEQKREPIGSLFSFIFPLSYLKITWSSTPLEVPQVSSLKGACLRKWAPSGSLRKRLPLTCRRRKDQDIPPWCW